MQRKRGYWLTLAIHSKTNILFPSKICQICVHHTGQLEEAHCGPRNIYRLLVILHSWISCWQVSAECIDTVLFVFQYDLCLEYVKQGFWGILRHSQSGCILAWVCEIRKEALAQNLAKWRLNRENGKFWCMCYTR